MDGSAQPKSRLDRVYAAIDAANAGDPNECEVAGRREPAELVYGRRMTEALARLDSAASELLRIAARGQHIERWTSPRRSYPEGRVGYLTWRKNLGDFHARRLAAIMAQAGYDADEAARVGAIVRKERLKLDPEVQTLEDVACIVFLSHYIGDFSNKTDRDKLAAILAKTWRKMSDRGQAHALTLNLPAEIPALLEQGLARLTPEVNSGGSPQRLTVVKDLTVQVGGASLQRQPMDLHSVSFGLDTAVEQAASAKQAASSAKPGIGRADLDELRQFSFFSGLDHATLQLIAAEGSIENVPGKTFLFESGGIPEYLFVLLDGLVQLLDRVGDDDVTILLLEPVTCFVTAAVLRGEPLLTAARTVKPSRIVRIPTELARRMFAEDPAFARAITADVCLNYRNAIRELKNMRMRTGFERLVAWILAMQARSAVPDRVSLPFNKTLLAGRLGISPETLSRDLSRLAALGVTVQGRTLLISDLEKLRQSVSSDYIWDPSIP